MRDFGECLVRVSLVQVQLGEFEFKKPHMKMWGFF